MLYHGSNSEIPMSVDMHDGENVDLDTSVASTIILQPGTVTALFSLSGLAGGDPGRIVTLYNNTGHTCRVLEYDCSTPPNNSSAGNLIIIAAVYNSLNLFYLYNGESVTLQYLFDVPTGSGYFWHIRHGLPIHGSGT